GLGMLAQLVVLLLLVAKHPGVRYLLPVAATVPLFFAAGLDGLDVRLFWTRLAQAAIGTCLLALFAVNLVGAATAHWDLASRVSRDDLATEQMLTRLAEQRGVARDDLRTVWTYGTTSSCYALWFADDYTHRTLRLDIQAMCAHDANLNVWSGRVA